MRRATSCAMRRVVCVIDKHEPGGYVTPYEAAGEDATYINRIREDATVRERPGCCGACRIICAKLRR